MAARKTERQLNLLIALMTARRPLNRSEIRSAVSGYGRSDPDVGDDEDTAFLRMFERDKAELREMGVQVETVHQHLWNEEAYRLPPGGLALQPLDLTTDEAAAVAMAVRAWRGTDLAAQAAQAAAKLDLLSVETTAALPVSLEPVEPAGVAPRHAWEDLRAAAEQGRAVSFDYRPSGPAQAAERTVEPYGLVAWRGHWYLVGHDQDRDAVRSFRLSRVVGSVRVLARAVERPRPDLELVDYVRGLETAPPTAVARVRVRPGRGLELRRSAVEPDSVPTIEPAADPAADPAAARAVAPAWQPSASGPGSPAATAPGYDPAEWDALTVAAADPARLAGLVAGCGPDAVVDGPAPLRHAVVALLTAAAERHR